MIKLSNLCKNLGGRIIKVNAKEFENTRGIGYFRAPFTTERIMVNWEKKELIYSPPVTASYIIHEMGHIFASMETPDSSSDWPFLGWEYAVVRYIGMSFSGWVHANSYYMISANKAIRDLTAAELKEVLEERLKYAKKSGKVSKDGVPLSIR